MQAYPTTYLQFYIYLSQWRSREFFDITNEIIQSYLILAQRFAFQSMWLQATVDYHYHSPIFQYCREDPGSKMYTVIQCLFLFLDNLISRLDLYSSWNFKNPNNGICVLKLPFKTLIKFTKRTQRDKSINDGMNRVTYFASYVKVNKLLIK